MQVRSQVRLLLAEPGRPGLPQVSSCLWELSGRLRARYSCYQWALSEHAVKRPQNHVLVLSACGSG
jgi:hypothetical protein